ncbi:MAG: polyphosphate kinase 1 [Bacteroidales bacterium]|nr:polyphosphate kinase 1 [Bacteroidales bacterium]
MSFRYKYFNRDISWLAFNYRVLEEAKDTTLPLYEQMSFLAIYSSNLDEFYRVRVAEYRNSAEIGRSMDEVSNPKIVLSRINHIVSEHIVEMSDILKNQIAPSLLKHGVRLYLGEMPESPEHLKFVRDYFYREVIPYLQPVLLTKGTRTFLRDNRPYLALKLYSNSKRSRLAKHPHPSYALVKLPLKDPPFFNDLPRFVELPESDGLKHIMFLDDVIRLNLHELFPGYDIAGAWSIKVSRDADLGVDLVEGDIVEVIKQNLSRRSTGEPSSFYHDRNIDAEMLKYLRKTFNFKESEIVASGRYLNLHHLTQFPKELIKSETLPPIQQIRPRSLQTLSMFDAIRQRDHVLHFPYQSFDYVIRLINEAAINPDVEEIKVTQYRVATNSAVVNSLIAAANNDKKVTVFVELKARFDEKNNLELSELMKEAGIKIIYSIPGLKVHAKMALIRCRNGVDFAYLSTGNFNEKTARQYTDHGLFTADKTITSDLVQAFDFLENQNHLPELQRLMLTQVNLKASVIKLIDGEIDAVRRGEEGYILLKMNGLQHRELIAKLYEASMAGVKIDLIIRGICCLVPDQPYSQNIRIIRIVDRFLEHGRVWVFGRDGVRGMYLTSSDWMNRNLKRRIEMAFPIDNQSIRKEILDILELQLADNVKARLIDENLVGHLPSNGGETVRAQFEIYNMLKRNNQ